MKRPLSGLLLAAAGLLVTVAATPSAQAAFPGRNGWIAFDNVGMLSVDPDGPGVGIIGRSGYNARYSRYGGKVAFGCGTDVQDNCRRGVGIRIKRSDGRGRARRITRNHWDDYPDWSPSGKSIVFTRYPRGELTAPELWIYRRGRSRYLTQGEKPAWSVRGEIVFERNTVFGPDGSPIEGPDALKEDVLDKDNSDPSDLYVIRPGGSGLRRITQGYQPEWSPHGSTIIFSTNACGYSCLHTVRRDGRERRRIGRGIAGLDPDYSPDGRRVVFSRAASSQIAVMRRDGTKRRVIFQAGGDFIADAPDWQSVLRRRAGARRPTSCGAGARIAC